MDSIVPPALVVSRPSTAHLVQQIHTHTVGDDCKQSSFDRHESTLGSCAGVSLADNTCSETTTSVCVNSKVLGGHVLCTSHSSLSGINAHGSPHSQYGGSDVDDVGRDDVDDVDVGGVASVARASPAPSSNSSDEYGSAKNGSLGGHSSQSSLFRVGGVNSPLASDDLARSGSGSADSSHSSSGEHSSSDAEVLVQSAFDSVPTERAHVTSHENELVGLLSPTPSTPSVQSGTSEQSPASNKFNGPELPLPPPGLGFLSPIGSLRSSTSRSLGSLGRTATPERWGDSSACSRSASANESSTTPRLSDSFTGNICTVGGLWSSPAPSPGVPNVPGTVRNLGTHRTAPNRVPSKSPPNAFNAAAHDDDDDDDDDDDLTFLLQQTASSRMSNMSIMNNILGVSRSEDEGDHVTMPIMSPPAPEGNDPRLFWPSTTTKSTSTFEANLVTRVASPDTIGTLGSVGTIGSPPMATPSRRNSDSSVHNFAQLDNSFERLGISPLRPSTPTTMISSPLMSPCASGGTGSACGGYYSSRGPSPHTLLQSPPLQSSLQRSLGHGSQSNQFLPAAQHTPQRATSTMMDARAGEFSPYADNADQPPRQQSSLQVAAAMAAAASRGEQWDPRIMLGGGEGQDLRDHQQAMHQQHQHQMHQIEHQKQQQQQQQRHATDIYGSPSPYTHNSSGLDPPVTPAFRQPGDNSTPQHAQESPYGQHQPAPRQHLDSPYHSHSQHSAHGNDSDLIDYSVSDEDDLEQQFDLPPPPPPLPRVIRSQYDSYGAHPLIQHQQAAQQQLHAAQASRYSAGHSIYGPPPPPDRVEYGSYGSPYGSPRPPSSSPFYGAGGHDASPFTPPHGHHHSHAGLHGHPGFGNPASPIVDMGLHHALPHLPAPPPPQQVGPKFVYNVKFKRATRSFILNRAVSSPFCLDKELRIGAHVMCEADRGEDLGVVVSRISAERFNASVRSPPPSSVDVASSAGCFAADLKMVLRVASSVEISDLTAKSGEETMLLNLCRTKVKQRQLPMIVLDAEYQSDRNKLTFFFHASGRIDFRELVRDLFSLYKTRIWMQQVGSGEVAALQQAAIQEQAMQEHVTQEQAAQGQALQEGSDYRDRSYDWVQERVDGGAGTL